MSHWRNYGSSLEWTTSRQPYPLPLPEAPSESEHLALAIERAVRWRTQGGVRDLRVEVDEDRVRLHGYCQTYYCKQLAQQAAMAVPGAGQLTNDIEVW